MSVRVADGIVHLEGQCGVEDAEPLLVALRDGAVRAVDLERAAQLHFAVAQLLVAFAPPIAAMPSNPLLRDLVLSRLIQGREHVSSATI